jgi:branched-chain amino acid transport system permease protein
VTITLWLTQILNGLQFGILLFLLAAGLTLVFGIMNFVNLAHGSLYMMGAYFASAVAAKTGNFLVGALVAIPATVLLGIVVERVALSGLYARDHLDQVLATFGLVLFFNELVRYLWGSSPVYSQAPEWLAGAVNFGSGMLIRAGASNAPMVSALGVNIKLLNTMIFGLGAGLAGLAGLMAAPILSVQSGMGETILIQTLVVIIVGGIGSIRGAFLAALIVGVVDTLGRIMLPIVMMKIMNPSFAQAAGPAIASMLIYVLMAAVLAFKPQGLFPVNASR